MHLSVYAAATHYRGGGTARAACGATTGWGPITHYRIITTNKEIR
ncbi:hypothetical protein [Nonomuraea endophytica]